MITDTSKAPEKIAGMFDAIARHYDRLNHLLSAGLDRRWRARTIEALGLTGRERLLDMCTGTADLAIAAVARKERGARAVVGVDFSTGMLARGFAKIRTAGLDRRISLVRGDATCMPLAEASFDAASVAFGIRNVSDADATCQEFLRVLVPGGRLAVLEFGTPRLPGLRELYRWYFRQVLPRIGRVVSRHDQAYSYLPASVAEFPSGEAFAGVLTRAGFRDVSWRTFSFGIVYLYLATRGPGAIEADPRRLSSV